MREVRQRCGFGCIVCGCAIVQYHHFEPEYADADEHRPEGITLLCGTCHDKASRGLVNVEEVKQHNASPACKRSGFAHDFLFASRNNVHFQVGSATFRRHAVMLHDDEVLIGFEPPLEKGGPLQLFARLEDDEGAHLLEIKNNVWVAGTHHFDVETTGTSIIIRRKSREITLRMDLKGSGDIILDRLKMGYKGFTVSVENGCFYVKNPKGGQLTLSCPNIQSTLRLSSSRGVTL